MHILCMVALVLIYMSFGVGHGWDIHRGNALSTEDYGVKAAVSLWL